MNRPEIYGPVVHTLSFAEAAKQKIICNYKVVISVVTSAMLCDSARTNSRRAGGRQPPDRPRANAHLLANSVVEGDFQNAMRHGTVLISGDEVKAQQVANQIALAQAVAEHQLKKIFTFHSRKSSARSFTSEGSEGIGTHLPDFAALHVNGAMSTAARDGLMTEFNTMVQLFVAFQKQHRHPRVSKDASAPWAELLLVIGPPLPLSFPRPFSFSTRLSHRIRLTHRTRHF